MRYLVYNYDSKENQLVRKTLQAVAGEVATSAGCNDAGAGLPATPCHEPARSSYSANLAFATSSSDQSLTPDEKRRAHEIVRRELKQTTLANDILQRIHGVGFKSVPSMNVTEMRRCLKHGRQRLQCNRPHAPIALCEKILGQVTLGEFGHWLQLMYHLRRFVKGLVKSCNLTPAMQSEIVYVAQQQIVLEFEEPPEAALWCMEYAHAHYTTDSCAPDEYCSVVKQEAGRSDLGASGDASTRTQQQQQQQRQRQDGPTKEGKMETKAAPARCCLPQGRSCGNNVRVVPLNITMSRSQSCENSEGAADDGEQAVSVKDQHASGGARKRASHDAEAGRSEKRRRRY